MANSYLDKDGLLYFLQKIRANATPSMDGTASTGTAKRFALQDHVHPSDTSKAPLASPALTGTPTAPTATLGTSTTQIATTEFVANTVGAMTSGVSDVKIDSTSIVTSGIANIPTASSSAKGLMTSADKSKLDAISGLTLDIVAGTNVTVTPDTTNGTLTIASTDTKNTAGSTSSTSKLYLVGATTQGANPQTYSRSTAYVGTDGHLYSNSKQTVNLSDSQALTNKTYNGYTLGAACAKGVVTSISADSADVPTVTAVKNYITTAITGAASFQGTAPTTFAPTNYKKGWYWVVGTAGTYVGEVCEAGDMIFAVEDYSSAYSASDFTVIQTNLDITNITNAEIDVIVAS